MFCFYGSTVRLWDVNQEGKKWKSIIKFKCKAGRKTNPTSVTYSPDGRWVAAGCIDGSIQIWDHNKMFVSTIFQPKYQTWFGFNRDVKVVINQSFKIFDLKYAFILYLIGMKVFNTYD